MPKFAYCFYSQHILADLVLLRSRVLHDLSNSFQIPFMIIASSNAHNLYLGSQSRALVTELYLVHSHSTGRAASGAVPALAGLVDGLFTQKNTGDISKG